MLHLVFQVRLADLESNLAGGATQDFVNVAFIDLGFRRKNDSVRATFRARHPASLARSARTVAFHHARKRTADARVGNVIMDQVEPRGLFGERFGDAHMSASARWRRLFPPHVDNGPHPRAPKLRRSFNSLVRSASSTRPAPPDRQLRTKTCSI